MTILRRTLGLLHETTVFAADLARCSSTTLRLSTLAAIRRGVVKQSLPASRDFPKRSNDGSRAQQAPKDAIQGRRRRTRVGRSSLSDSPSIGVKGDTGSEAKRRGQRLEPRESARIGNRSLGRQRRESADAINTSVARPTREESKTKSTSTPYSSLPYTTASSEFLYGTSIVLNALTSRNRKLFKLYVQDGEVQTGTRDLIRHKARSLGVNTVILRGVRARLLDRMSGGRPHNGLVLEASPLEKKMVTTLEPVGKTDSHFRAALTRRSSDDAELHDGYTSLRCLGKKSRFPLVLMLDGILDPGNLGNILRSAFFLGVDAVVLSSHNAALSPVVLKAAAGASEGIQMISIQQTGSFVERSKKNGWRVYAAVAPSEGQPRAARLSIQEQVFLHDLEFPVGSHPCILMIGGEGTGLMPDLQKKATHLVSIRGCHRSGLDLDSLNVSVAVGMLCDGFLKALLKPQQNDQQLF